MKQDKNKTLLQNMLNGVTELEVPVIQTFSASDILRVVAELKMDDNEDSGLKHAYSSGFNRALEDLKRELNLAPQGE